MDAIKKPSAVRMHRAPPRCTEWDQFSGEETKGNTREVERGGTKGDTDMVIPDTSVFPTVADTASHFRLSLLPFQIEI